MALSYVSLFRCLASNVSRVFNVLFVCSIDIYFHQRNQNEHDAALALRDSVLRLRRDGAFVAVPLFRVNVDPIGPHPVGESCSDISV